MDFKDNTELFARNREEKVKNAPVCRVCGSKEIHQSAYGKPTMACVEFLRTEYRKLQEEFETYKRVSSYPAG